jgi:hypothetical protein
LVAFEGDYDNLFYQYQQGNLDDEFYESGIEDSIRMLAPWWKKLDLIRRPSFENEIERIMAGD